MLDSSDPDLNARIVEAAGGEGVAASIDTSGQPTARSAAVDALRTQGTYVEVGVGHDPTIAPSQQIIFPGSDACADRGSTSSMSGKGWWISCGGGRSLSSR